MAKKAARKKTTRKRKLIPIPDEAQIEFLNRELEWLEFNARVLHEAIDDRTPLLERLRFLSISSSNLDEFVMKRVGGLKRQVEAGVTRLSGGMNPVQQLAAVRPRITQLQTQQADCFQKLLVPELVKRGVHLLTWDKLSEAERAFAAQYFKANVFPVLTPLAVDPGLPFPFLSNLSISFGVTLRYPDQEEKVFARLKIPKIIPQWIQIKSVDANDTSYRFVSLMDIIRHNLPELFPDMALVDIMPFRITRNADIERDEEDVDDLLEMIAEELKQRRFADVVRLEHGPNPDPFILRFLMDELELTDADVYENPGMLDYTDLRPIFDLSVPDLNFPVWNPIVPPALLDERANIMDVIRQGDLLVHHPYESFAATVERFIRNAVDDPKAIAIKMTLYRTGDDSPFIPLLIRAAERGKQVVVLIELKARFDEERNIHWAQKLEDAGVHVVYGLVGLKTHAKTTLVVRQETDGMRGYVHIGTGNYHKGTAKAYTDVGLFTANQQYVDDVVELFHTLTGRSLQRNFRKLLVAPNSMKEKFLERIRVETENAKAGKPARIIVKCNSLDDVDMIRSLYDASRAGVQIELIVRGFVSLRPKVAGMSDNIRVYSVIGRFLEHSRIFYFKNGAKNDLDGEFFVGSADWMHRNLHSRVEVVTPVEERALRERLWEILNITLNDTRSRWEMASDGMYTQFKPTDGAVLGTQEQLMKVTRERFTAQTTPPVEDESA
jgi:polyphosphate kinase